MDKQLLKFMNREVNVIKTMVTIGREPLNSNTDYLVVDDAEEGIRFIDGFRKRGNYVKKIPNGEEPKKKRSTGGKPAYAKLYIKELEKYKNEDLSLELAGVCLRLISFIEWDTGYLVDGRGKRRRYMDKPKIADALSVSLSTARRFLLKLEKLRILTKDSTGYKMSGKLLAKGRVFDAD